MPKINIEIECTPEQLTAIAAILTGSITVHHSTASAAPASDPVVSPPAAAETPAPKTRKKKGEAAATETPAAPAATPPAPATPPATVDIAAVRAVVVEASEKLTIPVVGEALQAVAGVRKASQVPPEKFEAVIKHLKDLIAKAEIV